MTDRTLAEREWRAALDAWQRGDRDAADAACGRAQSADPTWAEPWSLRGVMLRDRDAPAAQAAFEHAATLDPRDANPHFHLGNLFRAQERLPEAVAAYERAVERAPEHPSVLNNFALALTALGDGVRAEGLYRRVLARDAGHHQALGNLGRLLTAQCRYREALPLFARRLAQPGAAEADLWIDDATCRLAVDDADGAESSLRRALALAPDDATALTNLGSVLVQRGAFDEAQALLGRVGEGLHALYATTLRAYAKQHLCAWDGLGSLHDTVTRSLDDDAPGLVNPFVTLGMPLPASTQLKAARRWARGLAVHPQVARPAARARREGTPLRIGYLSSDLRTHAVAFLATEVWERHDRTRVHTTAYALAPQEDTPLEKRIATAFDTFVPCDGQDDAAIAKRVADDGIDVLVDLNGYTAHARSGVLARRPAAVQLHWLGYLGTLGAPWIDGVLTDRYATPPQTQDDFDETFVYLPDCYCPSDTRRTVNARDAGRRSDHGLPATGPVLCCFNQPYKILPDVFAAWMTILHGVPDAVLWLAPAGATAERNLREQASRAGIAPGRLVFAPRVPPDRHLARHAHADVFLDTTPYNAGTAANDALLMGVPVITCAGSTMASRVAGSQLRAVGLPELVTEDLASYASLACTIAGDRDSVAGYKARLAARRTAHPLFDMEAFTRHLEDALEGAWRSYAGRSASS